MLNCLPTHVKAPAGGTLSTSLLQAYITYFWKHRAEKCHITHSPRSSNRYVAMSHSHSKPLSYCVLCQRRHSAHSDTCIRIPLGADSLKHRLLGARHRLCHNTMCTEAGSVHRLPVTLASTETRVIFESLGFGIRTNQIQILSLGTLPKPP